MATAKRLLQALSLMLFGEDNAGPGYFDPESRRQWLSGKSTIEDRARLVG